MSALLSGTAAQLALDFLRSGRILKEGGLETLKKAYKATNRGEAMPEEAVSEFKRILNALKTRDAAEQIYRARTLRDIPLEDRPPSSLPPVSEPISYAKYIEKDGLDKVLNDMLQNAEYGDINAARHKQLMAKERALKKTRGVTDGWYASSSDNTSRGGLSEARMMQSSRRNAALSRADIQRLEAMYRLFGDLIEK